MKKIIDGRKYDTDTATELAEWKAGWPREMSRMRETLYRKRTGEYFLLGEGGPESRYAVQTDLATFSEGWRIMPYTYEQARAWAEDRLDADEYESIFGEVTEGDGGKVTVSMSISEQARAKLRRESERTGESQSDIVDRLLLSL